MDEVFGRSTKLRLYEKKEQINNIQSYQSKKLSSTLHLGDIQPPMHPPQSHLVLREL